MHFDDLIERLRSGSNSPLSQALMNEAVEAIEKLQKELHLCRNELCQHCGEYIRNHDTGYCNDCKWRGT